MRVLTWNLFHGRAVPAAGRELLGDFAAALAAWEWSVALLQEVPPWWPPALAGATGASYRRVLTSRNLGLPVRRWAARRWPDLIKSNGGGCNAILVRGASIAEHRRARLCLLPERRWLHAVRLEPAGAWVANVHLEASLEQAHESAAILSGWSGSGAAVLGGDFNLSADALAGAGDFAWAGGERVDHVLARGLTPHGFEVLDRGTLSDHAPVMAVLSPTPAVLSPPAPGA